jgi:hypothetical protein
MEDLERLRAALVQTHFLVDDDASPMNLKSRFVESYIHHLAVLSGYPHCAAGRPQRGSRPHAHASRLGRGQSDREIIVSSDGQAQNDLHEVLVSPRLSAGSRQQRSRERRST